MFSSWKADVPTLEVLQRAGEMLVVPPGWWHAVVNIGENVAIAENYVMERAPVQAEVCGCCRCVLCACYEQTHTWDSFRCHSPPTRLQMSLTNTRLQISFTTHTLGIRAFVIHHPHAYLPAYPLPFLSTHAATVPGIQVQVDLHVCDGVRRS